MFLRQQNQLAIFYDRSSQLQIPIKLRRFVGSATDGNVRTESTLKVGLPQNSLDSCEQARRIFHKTCEDKFKSCVKLRKNAKGLSMAYNKIF